MNHFKLVSDFLISQMEKPFNNEVPEDIISSINHLNKEERSNLRSLLFNEAKKISLNGNTRNALFWLENWFLLIEKYTFRFHQVYFSPGTEIPDTIIELINNAERSLALCIFTISHYELSQSLTNAYKRGVNVRILTDDEKQFDKGSRIKKLHHQGIPVKTDNSRYHMHNKFGIIDERLVFTGSFNWTYTATKHNQENLLVTTNHDIVMQYSKEFERLWEIMNESWL